MAMPLRSLRDACSLFVLAAAAVYAGCAESSYDPDPLFTPDTENFGGTEGYDAGLDGTGGGTSSGSDAAVPSVVRDASVATPVAATDAGRAVDAAADAGKADAAAPSVAPDAGKSDAAVVVASEDAATPVANPSDAGKADAAVPAADSGPTSPPADAGSDAAAPANPSTRCVPGTYKGSFSGQVSLIPSLFGSLLSADITGAITIQMGTNTSGSQLIISNGSVTGKDQDGNPITAVVTGTLDCATKKLQNGKLTNGKYVRTSGTVDFTGTVTADYSPNPPSAAGSWKTSGGFLEGGGGSWSAVNVP
jgi:hypothetical protein